MSSRFLTRDSWRWRSPSQLSRIKISRSWSNCFTINLSVVQNFISILFTDILKYKEATAISSTTIFNRSTKTVSRLSSQSENGTRSRDRTPVDLYQKTTSFPGPFPYLEWTRMPKKIDWWGGESRAGHDQLLRLLRPSLFLKVYTA